jgi:hypothetical protein
MEVMPMAGRKPVSMEPGGREPLISTTVRLTRRHQLALRREVLERGERGEQTDGSAVIRELLDEWLAEKK